MGNGMHVRQLARLIRAVQREHVGGKTDPNERNGHLDPFRSSVHSLHYSNIWYVKTSRICR